MKKGGIGGAKTNKTGLKFEKDTDFSELVDKLPGYKVVEINFNDKKITRGFEVRRGNDLVPHLSSQVQQVH